MHLVRLISTRLRRGVSLLELLVGIAIVVAIGAVVIPWTTGWLGKRELDNAEDGITMQLMMARAAAREEGRPVEVIAQSNGSQSRINARFLSGAEESGVGRARRGSSTDDGGFESDAAAPINAPWASMALPLGVRIALGLTHPDAAGSSATDEPSLDEPEFDTGSKAETPTTRGQTLAIFLPDGTVFFAPTFMLWTDAGSLRAMQVDRTTGVPQQVDAKPRAANEDLSDDADRPEFDGVDFDDATNRDDDRELDRTREHESAPRARP